MDKIENSMDRNTLLLEQCRLEMDELAALGEDTLRAAVFQAEKQARSCMMEWKQAQKTVELTAQQYKSLEETRAVGEEKLSLVTAEEEDARIALETVQRMIDDANKVRCVANTDTARILAKAGSVLDETARRAAIGFQEKQSRREEIEASMRRLGVTEKAVLYTMAKAERNASEKKLVKVIAEYRQQVCGGEFDAIKLSQEHDLLRERLEKENASLQQMLDELSAKERAVWEKEEEILNQQRAAEQELKEQQEQLDTALREIDDRLAAQNSLRVRAEQRVIEAENNCTLSEDASAEAFRRAAQVAQSSSDAINAANAQQQQALATLEQELEHLRTDLAELQIKADQARTAHQATLDQSAQLQRQMDECSAKADLALAEEESARDAALTAIRLAENATKIRESISSESSELLLHAQEVLMEAAVSAQQLMDSKNQSRQSAEHELVAIREAAERASLVAEEAGLRVELAVVDQNQAEEKLAAETERLERATREWEERTSETIAAAEKESREAERLAEEKHGIAQSARNNLEKFRGNLADIQAAITRLEEERRECEDNGMSNLHVIQARTASELLKLNDAKQAMEENLVTLRSERVVRQDLIVSISDELERLGDLERDAHSKVNEIIALGVLDIINCGEEVSASRYKEESSRKARVAAEEEAISLDLFNEDRFSMMTAANDALEQPEDAEPELDIEEFALAAMNTEPDDEPEAEEIAVELPLDLAELLEDIEVEEPAEESVPEELIAAEEEAEPVVEAAEEVAAELPELDPRDAKLFTIFETLLPPEEVIEEPVAAEPIAEPMAEPVIDAPVVEAVADAPVAEAEISAAEPAAEVILEAIIEATVPAAEAVPAVDEPAKEELTAPQAAAEEAELLADIEPAPAAAQPVEPEQTPSEEPVAPTASEIEEQLADLMDFSGLTEEEVEYTQRIEVMSNNMVANMQAREQELELPISPSTEYADWMEQLAKSLINEGEKPVPAPQSSQKEEAEVDMPVIQEAVLHVNEAAETEQPEDDGALGAPGEDEQELRESIITGAEVSDAEKAAAENAPKKRRFPFF